MIEQNKVPYLSNKKAGTMQRPAPLYLVNNMNAKQKIINVIMTIYITIMILLKIKYLYLLKISSEAIFK